MFYFIAVLYDKLYVYYIFLYYTNDPKYYGLAFNDILFIYFFKCVIKFLF